MEFLQNSRLFKTIFEGLRLLGTTDNSEVSQRLIPQISNFLLSDSHQAGMKTFIHDVSQLKSAGLTPDQIQKQIMANIAEKLNISPDEALEVVLIKTGLDQFDNFEEYKKAFDK